MTRLLWLILGFVATLALGGKSRRGRNLTRFLTWKGGVWAKLGQQLSTRYDLFPADVCDALRDLQMRTLPVTSYGADVVRRELGSLDDFATFDDAEPIGATIGQIHKGSLTLGPVVAVKVLKPGIRGKYCRQLWWMRQWARVIDVVAPRACAKEMAAELTEMMLEELDLRYELSNMEKMGRVLMRHGIRVPIAYGHLCTASVLVMEWIDGIPMARILKMTAEERAQFFRRVGTTGRHVAKRLLRSIQTQMFETNRFHTDLNPGNILVTWSGVLYLLDFGATSTTDMGFLLVFIAFVTHLSQSNFSRAADKFCELCSWPAKGRLRMAREWFSGDPGLAPVRRELVNAMRGWATRAGVANLPFGQKSWNALSIVLMMPVLRWKGTLQAGFFRLMRAISTLDGPLSVLWSSIDYVRELRMYLGVAARRERLRPVNPARLANHFVYVLEQLSEWLRIQTITARTEAILQRV